MLSKRKKLIVDLRAKKLARIKEFRMKQEAPEQLYHTSGWRVHLDDILCNKISRAVNRLPFIGHRRKEDMSAIRLEPTKTTHSEPGPSRNHAIKSAPDPKPTTVKPKNMIITFSNTSKSVTLMPLAISPSKAKKRKRWPKTICNKQLATLHSKDAILAGAKLANIKSISLSSFRMDSGACAERSEPNSGASAGGSERNSGASAGGSERNSGACADGNAGSAKRRLVLNASPHVVKAAVASPEIETSKLPDLRNSLLFKMPSLPQYKSKAPIRAPSPPKEEDVLSLCASNTFDTMDHDDDFDEIDSISPVNSHSHASPIATRNAYLQKWLEEGAGSSSSSQTLDEPLDESACNISIPRPFNITRTFTSNASDPHSTTIEATITDPAQRAGTQTFLAPCNASQTVSPKEHRTYRTSPVNIQNNAISQRIRTPSPRQSPSTNAKATRPSISPTVTYESPVQTVIAIDVSVPPPNKPGIQVWLPISQTAGSELLRSPISPQSSLTSSVICPPQMWFNSPAIPNAKTTPPTLNLDNRQGEMLHRISPQQQRNDSVQLQFDNNMTRTQKSNNDPDQLPHNYPQEVTANHLTNREGFRSDSSEQSDSRRSSASDDSDNIIKTTPQSRPTQVYNRRHVQSCSSDDSTRFNRFQPPPPVLHNQLLPQTRQQIAAEKVNPELRHSDSNRNCNMSMNQNDRSIPVDSRPKSSPELRHSNASRNYNMPKNQNPIRTCNNQIDVHNKTLNHQNQSRNPAVISNSVLQDMEFKKSNDFLRNICNRYFKYSNCRRFNNCRFFHELPDPLCSALETLKSEHLRENVRLLIEQKHYEVICYLLSYILRGYVAHQAPASCILELVRPILECRANRQNQLLTIIGALQQYNVRFNDAIGKILRYVGASNTNLVDMLFAIIVERTQSVHADWQIISELMDDGLSKLDHGVFADLCNKSLTDAETLDMRDILKAIATLLLRRDRIDLDRVDSVAVAGVCAKVHQYGMEDLAHMVRRARKLEDEFDATVRERTMSFDNQKHVITSTSHGHDQQIYFEFNNPASQSRVSATSKTSNFNPDFVKHNSYSDRRMCSPDSSSFGGMAPPSTVPRPNSAHITTTNTRSYTPVSPPEAYNPEVPSTSNEATKRKLYNCVLKGLQTNVVALITSEGDTFIQNMCEIIEDRKLTIKQVYSFFIVMWDRLEQIGSPELRPMVLLILYNIYEFLNQNRLVTESAHLLHVTFSKDKSSFLNSKTFVSSGQCSPFKKCITAVNILLEEQFLREAFDWFQLQEFHDISSPDFVHMQLEQVQLIDRFIMKSYNDLSVAYDLITYCQLIKLNIDYDYHYNSIIQGMLNNSDYKSQIIEKKNQLFRERYKLFNSSTLRSYIVEFLNVLDLDECLHIYEFISRENCYPLLTGHEQTINLYDNVHENEIKLILTTYLHRIVQTNIKVTWDVTFAFQSAASSTQNIHKQRIYANNLLVCSTIPEAMHRLVSVLEACCCGLVNTLENEAWRKCPASGWVVLPKQTVAKMVKNYRGKRTFMG